MALPTFMELLDGMDRDAVRVAADIHKRSAYGYRGCHAPSGSGGLEEHEVRYRGEPAMLYEERYGS